MSDAADTRLPSPPQAQLDEVRKMSSSYDQFVRLTDLLIGRNPALESMQCFAGPLPTLTPPQRVLATLSLFDMQIMNGGLLQFFWNCPGWVDQVEPSLRAVGLPPLAEEFSKAVQQLCDDGDDFLAHRERDSLAAYAEAAEDIDFEWFEDLYFGEADGRSWTGLVQNLYERTVAYVFANLPGYTR